MLLGTLGDSRLMLAAIEVFGEVRRGATDASRVEDDAAVGRPVRKGDRMHVPVDPQRQPVDDVLGADSSGAAGTVVAGVDGEGRLTGAAGQAAAPNRCAASTPCRAEAQPPVAGARPTSRTAPGPPVRPGSDRGSESLPDGRADRLSASWQGNPRPSPSDSIGRSTAVGTAPRRAAR
jgi:hypothetical protein